MPTAQSPPAQPPCTLRELLIHNDWARERLLALAAPLADEPLDRKHEMGLGSIRATLHHMWGAEQIWLDRWQEKPSPRFDEMAPGLPVAALADRFRQTAGERDAFLDRAGDAGFCRRIAYRNIRGEPFIAPLGDMVLHVANHGVHHRAQAINMLRHSGVEIPRPGVDYIFMKLETGCEPLPRFDLDTIAEYFRYGDWATGQVLTAAAGFSDEQLDRAFEMGLGSLRRTLLHILGAEQWWRTNWLVGPGQPFPDAGAKRSLAEIRAALGEATQRRAADFAAIDSAALAQIVTAQPRPDVTRRFPLGVVLTQLCTHGTHHRAQAINMVRRLGGAAPALDYIIWQRLNESR